MIGGFWWRRAKNQAEAASAIVGMIKWPNWACLLDGDSVGEMEGEDVGEVMAKRDIGF